MREAFLDTRSAVLLVAQARPMFSPRRRVWRIPVALWRRSKKIENAEDIVQGQGRDQGVRDRRRRRSTEAVAEIVADVDVPLVVLD